MITGETFLKDARQIDQSIQDMNEMTKTVTGLEKAYNDDEVASDAQLITIAIDQQDAAGMSELGPRENENIDYESEAGGAYA